MRALAKRFIKKLIYQPRGIRIGKTSFFRRPWIVINPDSISVGEGVSIGRESVLHPVKEYAGITFDPTISIGDNTYIGGYSQIHAMTMVKIGRECVLSEYVYISDIAHGLKISDVSFMKQPLESKGPVQIGDYVFIGFGASVLPGVTLGDYCIVGTGSVVTKSFPAGSVIGGVPARLLHRRSEFL